MDADKATQAAILEILRRDIPVLEHSPAQYLADAVLNLSALLKTGHEGGEDRCGTHLK